MQLLKGHEGKKVKTELNGQALEVVVSIKWDYEGTFPEIGQDFDFGDQKDNEAYLKRFDKGELCNLMVSVIARAEGVEGIDHLGGCHVSVQKWDADLLDLVNDHGMIENAIADLKTNIIEAASKLQRFTKGA